MGNPGVVSNRDHLRKVREEKLTFAPDEYMVRLDVEYNERNIQTLTVVTSSGREHTFFDKWIIDNNEKTLRDMQSVEDVEPTIEELSAPDGHRIVWACSNPHTGADIFLARGDVRVLLSSLPEDTGGEVTP